MAKLFLTFTVKFQSPKNMENIMFIWLDKSSIFRTYSIKTKRFGCLTSERIASTQEHSIPETARYMRNCMLHLGKHQPRYFLLLSTFLWQVAMASTDMAESQYFFLCFWIPFPMTSSKFQFITYLVPASYVYINIVPKNADFLHKK